MEDLGDKYACISKMCRALTTYGFGEYIPKNEREEVLLARYHEVESMLCLRQHVADKLIMYKQVRAMTCKMRFVPDRGQDTVVTAADWRM